MKTSALASIMILPREGHLKELYHMFAFLKSRHNVVMVFNPIEPHIDNSTFPSEDWLSSSYGKCKRELLNNTPKARGLGITIIVLVDLDCW